MLPHTAGTGWQRIRIGLDAAIGAISVGALAWVFVIDPIVIGLEGAPLAARIFGVLYPLVDVGALDLCVLVGYPGSLISSWQRIGRVGRVRGFRLALDQDRPAERDGRVDGCHEIFGGDVAVGAGKALVGHARFP